MPLPVNPHTSATVREYLRTPYVQSIWIVPVRGVMPWRECSSAVVLSLPPSGDPDPLLPFYDNHEITWTHPSLLGFWSFLLAIRDAHTLGPMALSFHTASSPDPDRVVVANGSSHSSLLEVDHVRIYHDAACAMLIRNVLDAWAYSTGHPNEKGSEVEPKPRKIRVLKGTKLVLLDDCSKAIVIF